MTSIISKMIELITSAKRIIRDAITGKCNPVIYFSGGKDSMVMLHLIRFGMGLEFPVIFHREPWQQYKYEFTDFVIRMWNLTAYDYPPSGVSLWNGKGLVAFTNYYQTAQMPDGIAGTLALPKNIVEPQKSSDIFACALVDILQRPTGTFKYPWDVSFIGHKSSDEDQIAGKVPLHAEIVNNEYGPRLAFPLRDWTDKDIWDYIEENSIPYQRDRYENRAELPDKIKNSDYVTACIRCVDIRNKEEHVHCPLKNGLVPNVSSEVPYNNIELDYFGEK